MYCTVGNEEKVDFLATSFEIPHNRVFHSRDASFHLAICQATRGRGVDVVLNSLSSELMHASWQCVAEFGTLVEVGRRDFVGQGKLALEQFESNRTFVGLNLSLLNDQQPYVTASLLQRSIQFYEQGHIKPIFPITRMSAMKPSEAIRVMQRGTHIGKIVVTMPEDAADLPSEAAYEALTLREDGSYLFVGGLGGLGRSITTWLAEKGARHFVFLSRSAGQMLNDDLFCESWKAWAARIPGFRAM